MGNILVKFLVVLVAGLFSFVAHSSPLDDQAAQEAIKAFGKIKNLAELISQARSSLPPKDQKSFDGYLETHPVAKMPSMKNAKGRIEIRADGQVVYMKIVDAKNGIVAVEGTEVDLSPSVPLNEQIQKLTEIFQKKFAGNSRPGLAFIPSAQAILPIIAGGLVVGALIANATARDWWWADNLAKAEAKLREVRQACYDAKVGEKNRDVSTDAIGKRANEIEGYFCKGIAGIFSPSSGYNMVPNRATFDSVCLDVRQTKECLKGLADKVSTKDFDRLTSILNSIDFQGSQPSKARPADVKAAQ